MKKLGLLVLGAQGSRAQALSSHGSRGLERALGEHEKLELGQSQCKEIIPEPTGKSAEVFQPHWQLFFRFCGQSEVHTDISRRLVEHCVFGDRERARRGAAGRDSCGQ